MLWLRTLSHSQVSHVSQSVSPPKIDLNQTPVSGDISIFIDWAVGCVVWFLLLLLLLYAVIIIKDTHRVSQEDESRPFSPRHELWPDRDRDGERMKPPESTQKEVDGGRRSRRMVDVCY